MEEIIEANEEGWEKERGLERERLKEVLLEKDELEIQHAIYTKEIAENCGLSRKLEDSERENAGLGVRVLELEEEKLQIQNETGALIGTDFVCYTC